MNLLLDTNAFLWHGLNDPRLSTKARDLITDPDNPLFLSIASVWELAIKDSRDKLNLQLPLATFVARETILKSITILDIKVPHAILVGRLPFHHSDPFDRMLVAQALLARLPLVSSDAELDAYGVIRIW
jgi:PIN domain nuclease of toxin-antitoxin system